MKTTITHDDGTIIGWIHEHESCENPNCYRALAEGRPFHAIPRGFAVTLPDYHFASQDEAEAAIVEAYEADPEAVRQIEHLAS